MPMARAVRITRQAISPRLAMSILPKGGLPAIAGAASLSATLLLLFFLVMRGIERAPSAHSKRDIIVLFPWVIDLLVAQHGKAAADPAPRGMGHDDIVDEAAGTSDKGCGELCVVFLGSLGNFFRVADIGAGDNLHCALGSHHCDLGRRPGIVDVAAQMLGT